MTTIPKAIVFNGNGSDWSALREAERWIRGQGWSVGPSDTSQIRAVMFGPNWAISKWRNLTEAERASTHAVLQGRGRVGPLTLYPLVPPITKDPTP